MKHLFFTLSCLLLTLSFSAHSEETNLGVEFADAIIERHPATINDLTGKGWEYSNSIVLYGMQKIYEYTKNPAYLAYVKKYVDTYVDADGEITFDSSANNLDHLHPGLCCLFLYEQTGEDKYRLAAENIRKEFDEQPRNASGGFWHKQRYTNQMWADGIYMAEPFLVQYGNMLDDATYAIEEATKQVTLLAEHAYDTTSHLLYHGWDETLAADWADDNGRSPEVWSRGMGWYCMALVDMLDYIPEAHESHAKFIDLVQGLAQGIKATQDESTGLWYQVVDKGDISTNWIETSGSAMFVYMLQKGVAKGYLDSTYLDVVDKGWVGMQNNITLDSKKQPVINNFVLGMGIKSSYSVYVSQSRVSTPSSRYPHGYCAILSLASVMEWPKEKDNLLNVSVEGDGSVDTGETDSLFMDGRYVCLKAHIKNGSTFTGWSGDVESSDSIIYVKMDSTIEVKATFLNDATLSEDVLAPQMTIYPNPVKDKFVVKGDQTLIGKPYVVRSVSGELVTEGVLKSGEVDVMNLVAGYYFIEVAGLQASFIKL